MFLLPIHIDDAIEKAKESDAKEIFIIGGGEIFKQTMDIVDRIYLTRVHTNVEGDTSYPELDTSKWKLVRMNNHFLQMKKIIIHILLKCGKKLK